eukprot:NODE_4363_length_670_cov_46.135266_g3720_i0.p1 GENE.NODE_4363_length_670_cov_46.135266_g3720_i0~~NODE_4363_length_670_cov_46.135266_g3720_i0.p1  ORF type:complete len:120 (+),score=12.29 NODE_4363_length_670_cov_46.135266_g3720_i0:264-623(+)
MGSGGVCSCSHDPMTPHYFVDIYNSSGARKKAIIPRFIGASCAHATLPLSMPQPFAWALPPQMPQLPMPTVQVPAVAPPPAPAPAPAPAAPVSTDSRGKTGRTSSAGRGRPKKKRAKAE